jgi:hypothetical protein
MLHAILTDWVARGHECFVTIPGLERPYTYEGVVTFGTPRRPGELAALAAGADVVVTHLDNTGVASRAARDAGRPLVHLLHNDGQLQFHHVKPGPSVLIVANSKWLRATVPDTYTTIIARPHVDVARYAIGDSPIANRQSVTLINLTVAKGARTFYGLADLEPDRPFLGVRGAYGVQDDSPTRRPRNVEIISNTPRVAAEVYARTRVLLMPSGYESWGRVAIEAACSGIPTIAAPTPGLREALGNAGIFVPVGSVRDWHGALAELDDIAIYRGASARARALPSDSRRSPAAISTASKLAWPSSSATYRGPTLTISPIR